eukprot:NODE_61_length_26588_cov_1.146778.p10 type:complete len:156 gc:universal NODE_61_length_26588_cov_1.146778:21091-20624(-)
MQTLKDEFRIFSEPSTPVPSTNTQLPPPIYTTILISGFYQIIDEMYASVPIAQFFHLAFQDYYGEDQYPRIQGLTVKFICILTHKLPQNVKNIQYEFIIESKFSNQFRQFLDYDDTFKPSNVKVKWIQLHQYIDQFFIAQYNNANSIDIKNAAKN